MKNVRIITTNACNASILEPQGAEVCGFCFRHIDDIVVDRKMIAHIFAELRQFPQVEEVVLTGGEPLLSPHTMQAAHYAKRAGLYTTLHTNGILLKEKIDGLKDVDCISIPVDGSKPDIADYYRGKGFHRIALDCMRLLQENGKAIGVNTFVSDKNAGDLEDIAQLISEYLPRYWFLSEFRDVNAASRKGTGRYAMRPGAFLERAMAVQAAHPGIPIFYQESGIAYPPRVWLRLDGTVYANSTRDKHNEHIGNLRSSTLQEILAQRGLSL